MTFQILCRRRTDHLRSLSRARLRLATPRGTAEGGPRVALFAERSGQQVRHRSEAPLADLGG